MISLFITFLFATLIFTRILAYVFHDSKNYGTKREKSKTLTFVLRRKTNYDIHHIHIGFILLIFITFLISIKGFTQFAEIGLAISLSLIADQIFPLLKFGNYFSRKMITVSITLHSLISLLYLIITN